MLFFTRWRVIFTLKDTLTQSRRIEIASISPTIHSFHSTTAVHEKWKNKFNFDVGGGRQASKNYVRYVVKQKRADTKKALKGILYNGGCSTSRPESFSKIEADFADQLNKKSRSKPACKSKKACQKKLKRKHRGEDLFDDFDGDPDRVFRTTFGKRGFNWTFRPSEMGFDGTESYGWTFHEFYKEDRKSRIVYDNSCGVGSYTDRKTLDLPISGPLKIEDVKSAFRAAALKWHPDKHQGSSQACAEEKFKQCVQAYKSLCAALSTA